MKNKLLFHYRGLIQEQASRIWNLYMDNERKGSYTSPERFPPQIKVSSFHFKGFDLSEKFYVIDTVAQINGLRERGQGQNSKSNKSALWAEIHDRATRSVCAG